MRVAIDLTSLADNFSGIERYAASMAQAILKHNAVDQRNRYVLIFKEEVHPWFREFEGRFDTETYVLPRGRGGKAVFSQLTLVHHLRKINPDVSLFLAFPCPLLYGKKSVSTIHDLSCHDCPDTMTAKSRFMWRLLDGHAAAGHRQVITISEFSKSRIVDYYRKDPSEVTVAYCGVDQKRFTSSIDAGDEAEVRERYKLPDHFILSLSTIEPRKRLDLLIAAWSQLWDEGAINQNLVLAGRKGWKVDELLSHISDKARRHIYITGFVEENDLSVLYHMSDLFVFPSRYEGFGLPPVEAHNSGARVLCSDIQCLREVCGDRAAYFKSGDVMDLKRALTDPQLFIDVNEDPINYLWNTEAQKVLTCVNRVAWEMAHDN